MDADGLSVVLGKTVDRLLHIRRAVEAEDSGFDGLGREEKVEREDARARALEALDEVIRPPGDVGESDGMSHVGLLGRKMLAIDGDILLADELFVDAVHRTGLEAEAGGVADVWELTEDALAAFDPVMNDAELCRFVVEEGIEIACDDLVNIEEERWSDQIGESVLEDQKLDEDVRPEKLPSRRRLGEGLGVDAVDEPRRVVRDANESERTMQMLAYARVKTINVLGAVIRSPLKAEDIDAFKAHSTAPLT